MGLFSWLFPSPADRVKKAQKLLDRDQPAEARLEVMGLEEPEAKALLATAERLLTTRNLEAAVSWAHAGDDDRVEIHLELAGNFDPGDMGDAFKETRREIREIRAERRAAEEAEKARKNAWQTSIDPLGVTGNPEWLDGTPVSEAETTTEAEEQAMTLALAVESYPEDLRASAEALGKPFLQAVLDLDDGRPDLALQTLLSLPDEEPLVLWERARAANALGDPNSTARTLRQLAAASGHRWFGRQHSGELLARVTAETGDTDGALRTIREVRRESPEVGGPLLGSLLLHGDRLEEAETVLRREIKQSPKSYVLYDLLAETRIRGGHRHAAIDALERSMELNNCDSPGRCGYNPPPPQLMRKLATLYLEEGVKPDRVDELVQQALPGRPPQPGWEDVYLDALLARRNGDPKVQQLTQVLWDHTPEGHPGRARLTANLPRTELGGA